MAIIDFTAGGRPAKGYLAQPTGGTGPGVLVLHAWWGFTPVFHAMCDRLAEAGFTAFAPDLYNGKTASTIDQAEQLLQQRDFEHMQTVAIEALQYLRAQASGDKIATLGFSMGAGWAIGLASGLPDSIAAAVLFYGTDGADFAASRAAYLGHFGEDDEWEPLDGVRQMEADMRAAGRDVTFYTYPGAKHWFTESNRPEYDPQAAELAWERTIAFLSKHLK